MLWGNDKCILHMSAEGMLLRDPFRIPWACFPFSKAPTENANLQ